MIISISLEGVGLTGEPCHLCENGLLFLVALQLTVVLLRLYQLQQIASNPENNTPQK